MIPIFMVTLLAYPGATMTEAFQLLTQIVGERLAKQMKETLPLFSSDTQLRFVDALPKTTAGEVTV
jgi:hypothetical protein